ncbi:hypothetical protein SGPA1_50922 [Streptomyces misionensis JCM 4497]
MDRARPRHLHGRRVRARQGVRLDRLPRRGRQVRRALAEPDLRRHPRQHRLHAARQDPHALRRRRRLRAGAGLGPAVPLDRLHPAGRAAVRVEPQARLHRHRQPGRGRQGQVPVHPDHRLGLRHPQPADHRPDRVEDQGRRQDLHRRHAADAAGRQQRDRQAAGAEAAEDQPGRQERARRAEAAGGLGLHPGLRLGGRRVLQRRLAQHPQARLRQQAPQGAARQGPVPVGRQDRQHRSGGRRHQGARVRPARRRPGAAGRRRPLVRGRAQPDEQAGQRLVEDPQVGHPPAGRQHGPALRPRHDRRPLGADRQARQGHRHLELGPAAPPVPEEPDARHRRPEGAPVPAQPRPLEAQRRRGRGGRDRLERGRRLQRRLGAVDADGGQPRRPRQVQVDQPDRCLRARLQRPLHGPDGHVGQGRAAALVVLRQGGRQEHERHAGPPAVAAAITRERPATRMWRAVRASTGLPDSRPTGRSGAPRTVSPPRAPAGRAPAPGPGRRPPCRTAAPPAGGGPRRAPAGPAPGRTSHRRAPAASRARPPRARAAGPRPRPSRPRGRAARPPARTGPSARRVGPAPGTPGRCTRPSRDRCRAAVRAAGPASPARAARPAARPCRVRSPPRRTRRPCAPAPAPAVPGRARPARAPLPARHPRATRSSPRGGLAATSACQTRPRVRRVPRVRLAPFLDFRHRRDSQPELRNAPKGTG